MPRKNRYVVRVLEMNDGTFIPQVRVDHFLWGHHWEGVYEKEGELWQTQSDDTVLRRCKVTLDEANDILRRYTSRKAEFELLQS